MRDTSNKKTQRSVSRNTGRAALWQVLGGGWQTIVRLGASVFLARALEPRDFGLFGMAMIAQEFISYLGALGMSAGVITKKNITDDDTSTYFWCMAGMRFTMFLIAFFGAPIAAATFSEPNLTPILRAVSVTFVISIIQIVPETILNRNLQFGTLNMIIGASTVIESATAIGLAVWAGIGYWSLVFSMIIGTTFRSVSIFIAGGWRPKFHFDMQSFHYLIKFGITGLGFSLTNYLSQNLDYFLVGRVLGPQALGLYEYAYRIPHLVFDRIARPIGLVAFPALSKVQDSDIKLAAGYLKTVKFVCLLTFPFLAGLAAVANIAVPIIWGTKWTPIVLPLQILCLCSALRCPTQATGSIFYCKQRPDIPLKISLATLIWTAFSVGIMGYYYGLIGVALGMLFSTVPAFYSVILVLRMTNTPFSKFIENLAPIVLCTLTCAGAAYGIKFLLTMYEAHSLTILVCSIIAGVIAYPLSILLLFPGLTIEIIEAAETITNNSIPVPIRRLLEFFIPTDRRPTTFS